VPASAKPGAPRLEPCLSSFEVGVGRWPLLSCSWKVGIAVFPSPAVVVRAAELAVVWIGMAAPGPGLDVVALAALCRHVAALVSAATIEDVEGPTHGSGEAAGTSEVDDPRGTVEHHPLDERLVQ
jgi:hypothetical protein